MQTKNRHRGSKITCLTTFLLVVWIPIGCATDITERSTKDSIDFAGELLVRMDDKAMGEYRDSRQIKFAGSLARSELSKEHQALLANSLAKLYVGVPVSSFSETYDDPKLSATDSEITENWRVTDVGYLQNDTDNSKFDLRLNPVFIALPTPSLIPETAQLLKESDIEATFVFQLEQQKERRNLYEVLFMLDSNSDWIMEITAVKNDQSPKSVVLKIEPPDFESSEPRLVAQSYEFHYSFVESCVCFAVNQIKAAMEAPEGYEELIVPGLRSTQSTYSNIKCEKPLQFLLPDFEQPLVLSD